MSKQSQIIQLQYMLEFKTLEAREYSIREKATATEMNPVFTLRIHSST